MATPHSSANSRNVVTFTRKFRERIAREGMSVNQEQAKRLLTIPSKQRRISVDLSDAAMREFLASALPPLMHRAEAIPPALAGSARRVNIAIMDYERRTSNLDLFED